MSSKKRFEVEEAGIKVSSKSEVIVAQKLYYNGYRFSYDKKYPYKDLDQQFRYDFMILNASDADEEHINTVHHLFIEVKDDDKEYLQALQEKRNMVNDHDDVLLVVTDKEMGLFLERLKEATELLSLKADYKRLKYENSRLKELLKKNGIKY